MTIGMIDAQRRTLDSVREMIELVRLHEPQAFASVDDRGVTAAPPPPAPHERSAENAADTAQSPGNTGAGTVATAEANAGTSLAGVLDLSATSGSGGATTLLAPNDASAAAEGHAAAAAAGPSARPDQVALYELLLADPLLQEAVAAYCPEVPASVPSNATTDALVAMYGQDLTCRLLQASTAITRVFDAYCDAMDHAALQGPGTGGSGWVFVPGTPSCGESDGTPDRWEFSAEVFTADYAKGDSLAARAFASAHGDDGSFARITRVVTGYSDSGEIFHITSGGIDPGSAQFKRYDTSDSTSELCWDRARMSHAALTRIDLTQPREMFDPKAVWFDPNLGFVTANENIVPENNWAETVVVTVVIGVATWGVGSAICAAYGVTNAIAVGAIMGATGSVIGGLFQNGTVHFEDVVRGAITGAIMGAVSQNLDAKGIDPKTGAVTDWGARIGAISGKATIQGLLAEITGGDFKDAFSQGFATGLAAEVGRSINLEINRAIGRHDITADQASAYRTLGRAVTTAVAALADPDGSPLLASFAEDFLSDIINAEIPSPYAHVAIADNTAVADAQDEAVELNFDGVIDETFGTAAVGAEMETAGTDSGTEDVTGDTASSGRGSADEGGSTAGTGRSDGATNAGANEEVQRVEVTGSRTATGNGQNGGSSVYASQYVRVEGLPGVMPVGGRENLALARDLPMLSNEFTPNFADGRMGVGVPYRDQAGQVFYRTFDATGAYAGLVSAPALAAALPLAAAARVAAPVAEAVLTAELTFGTPEVRLAAGLTLAGTAWWVINEGSDPILRDALTPEEVEELQRPIDHVPVSPGPGGTPGQLADSQDTSTPGHQIPDVLPLWDSPTEHVPSGRELTIDDLIITRNPEGNPPKPDFVPSRTAATGSLGGTPQGYISPNPDSERGINRENEAAAAAAGSGYIVVQNPTLSQAERAANGISDSADPDLLIEGKVFDVKSPLSAAAAETAITDSVEARQSRRFLINANDFADPEGGVRDLASRLRERPPEGLQEVKVLVNGVIRNIFP